ncbi:hypothetical protein RF11_08374 [Thelohanellus kitauei]|uniref:PiggyBac transposable element-derived protein domain-containing protein n=1 Tax=Thelohanellus kitauei TaxID=669202 RepID=A0A0C2J7S0_THEKT|nr:hypothetical protein RF11_08374 [Thelohanellus kitauei]
MSNTLKENLYKRVISPNAFLFGCKKGADFCCHDINSPLVDPVWKNQLSELPQRIGSTLGYFFSFITIEMRQAWFVSRDAHSPSLSVEINVFNTRAAKEKRSRTGNPLVEIRLNDFGHLPLHMEEKGRYRHCKKSTIRNFCGKCGVYLCLTSNRNCFLDYHTT